MANRRITQLPNGDTLITGNSLLEVAVPDGSSPTGFSNTKVSFNKLTELAEVKVLEITSSANITVDINKYDVLKVTALAVSTTINITGTMHDAKRLLIEIKDNGTARGITLSSYFANAGGGLITTTTAGKWYHGIFIANTTTNKLMSVGGVIEP